ncbi:PP2C family protein-serine/threonine phosphatase [Pseudodesulfovibrio sediminis]|uniref:HAMP domain-containing protein n=1 Tax=Pseudodesulfovibrio sediminis TaxID=2810563 RepID=A0ABM9SDZ5_9BACT|nr:SpoIIE family protein phosphatase [Pseudodesulfovibrio sediminis]BCS89354.1 hypothetical protein PSDVSF_25960 [Pseudodesulfovibrio sediminis]
MVQLPVWELGLIILIPMAGALLLRWPLQNALIEPSPSIRQSALQFRLELGLFLGAGLASAFILLFMYDFPLLHSGMKLVLGIITVGLFAGLDIALARERMIIEKAQTGRANYAPPRILKPMTRTFTFIAILILLLITAIILLVIIRDVNWLATQNIDMDTIGFLSRSVLIEIVFVMGILLLMVVNLILSYSRNLSLLFKTETQVLENVARGNLTRRVPVTTSDEMGVIAGHTNAMISALREGVRMREGLLIAQEVQQHFLPGAPPAMAGLDIAGVSVFSDETGGDFYDFIECDQEACGELGIMVGDVSGHGIGAALLMTTGRAVIRQNAATEPTVARAIDQSNRHLTRDMGETGRFLTLFFMSLNQATQTATWVNAGQQPPLVYDPETDTFSQLMGENIPLGVVEDWQFSEHTMDFPDKGQVILIGTDGAWEARNADGVMFGSGRVKASIRAHHRKNAEEIMTALCDEVMAFAGDGNQEDDITLVVIKGASR